ncbi:MAG TPA: hypothetical protein VKB76_03815 [Ktedonobacterales bacterium]|nr:hypothetical protein [Ktedonobacterales bacterium]
MAPIILAITGGPPPQLAIPTPGQATLGWIMALAVFFGPLVLNFVSWRRRRRRWWAFITQWHTIGFWGLFLGAIIAAAGMFTLMGVIPAWQSDWNTWFTNIFVQNNASSADDRAILLMNQTIQQQYAFALQVAAAIVFFVGALSVFLGQQRLARRMMEFHEGPDDWLVAPPDTEAASTRASRALNHPFSTQS